jgi:hypothetical protein
VNSDSFITLRARIQARLRQALYMIGKNYAFGSACIGGRVCIAIVAEALT